MKLLILNGPNLNLLGSREPDTYGRASLADIEKSIRSTFVDVEFEFYQSNHEGDLIDRIQAASTAGFDGIVLNAAGFTHTSVALRDAIAAVDVDVVEVHISNIHAREEFRHRSLTAAVAVGLISGLGPQGYALAVRYFIERPGAAA